MLGIEITGLVVAFLSGLLGASFLHQIFSRQLNYLNDPQLKLKRLTRRFDDLRARESYICSKLEEGKVQQGKVPNPEVELWLKDVKDIETSLCLRSLGDEILEAGKRKLLHKYISISKLGKLIEDKIEEVKKLLKKGRFSDESLAYLPAKRGIKLIIPPLYNLKTHRAIDEEIWEYLMDDSVGGVGVYGMGGVGKTTIMQGINNRLIKLCSLPKCYTIWVTVTKDSNLVQLQDKIAGMIDLGFAENLNEMTRAARLSEALERRGRFVLILDDIWKEYPLEDIGIPLPTRENGCKLLLTTRLQSVCERMRIQKFVEVKVLDKKEAWDMFKDVVGHEVFLSPKIQTVAIDVAEECDGLPLAIVTVGKALRCRDDVDWWINARDELRHSTAKIDDMEEKVFERLRFSYEKLRDDETRYCFLYCALFAEDFSIGTDVLIRHWIWDGLLGDERRLQDKIRAGKIILHELIEASMLEKIEEEPFWIYCSDENEYVKMHDLIRDMAIRITREKPRFVIKAGLQLKEYDEGAVEWPEDVDKMSLMANKLEKLSGQPRCSRLSTLLLKNNTSLRKISNPFFTHMHNLRVLDLSCSRIQSLPESLSCLINLEALLLCACGNLSSVPSLASLKKLKALDLSWTSIRVLPHGMEMLKHLCYLDLTSTSLQQFQTGLLPLLTSLEDFRLVDDDFLQRFGYGGQLVEEFEMCTKLKVLHFRFLEMLPFCKYLKSKHSDQLESFKLFVGCIEPANILIGDAGKNSVSLYGCNLVEWGGTVYLPANTHELTMKNCSNAHFILSMWLSKVEQLKTFKIKDCEGTPDIMVVLGNYLNMIETLELSCSRDLRELWSREFVPPCAATGLKVFKIHDCNIRILFFRKLLQHLPNLEKIIVRSCSGMEEIIAADETDMNDIIVLPKLKWLELNDLQSLQHIYRGVLRSDFLQSIKVNDCTRLSQLPLYLGENPHQLSSPKSLKEISGEQIWWDSLEWNPPDAKTLLQPLFKCTSIAESW